MRQDFKNISNQVLVYPSHAFKNWACLPLVSVYFYRIREAISPTFLQSLILDFRSLWGLMLIALGVAILLALVASRLTSWTRFGLAVTVLAGVGALLMGATCLAYTLVQQSHFERIN